MKIFAIGDLHLSSDGTKPMDIYGVQWVNHPERLKQKWRSVVSEEDVVIIAGDISWAMKRQAAEDDLSFIAELPGKKVIIKGNHDLWWTSVSKLNLFHESMFFCRTLVTWPGKRLFAAAGAGCVPVIPILRNRTKRFTKESWEDCAFPLSRLRAWGSPK